MPTKISDETALIFYREVIIPWEKGLISETGCWDIKRTRIALARTVTHLECVNTDQVSAKAQDIRRTTSRNFLVWANGSSQAQDLFRYIRNCAGHAGFSTSKSGRGPQLLKFRAIGRDKKTVVMEGDIEVVNLAILVKSLVSR